MPFYKVLKTKFIAFIIIMLVLFTFANILAGYLYLPGNLKENKTIIIKPGTSISRIARILAREGVINNRILFKFISYIHSKQTPLKSGEYNFTKNISPHQVLMQITNGKSVTHKITFVEGMTVSQIINKINNTKSLIGSEVKDDIPEGFLMPSTYHYSYGDQKQKIIQEMKKQMSNHLDLVMSRISPNSPLKNRQEVLILASIIEKEAGNHAEKPLIAAAFTNRLKRNIKLQADPTVIYAITKGKTKLNRLLKSSDLRIKSPYNTYVNHGLPEGPICCPGDESLQAAINPDDTDVIFFVANGKDGHNFAKTLQQHNKNVALYRKLQRSKKK